MTYIPANPPTHPPAAARTAVVTGAGRGIGRGLALGLADQGYAVALVGRTRENLEAVAAEIGDRARTVVVSVDLTDGPTVLDAARQIESEFDPLGGVGLLVNNAGVVEREEVPFAQEDVEDAWRVVEQNLRGPLLITHALLSGMLARGVGRIANLNSGAAYRASATYTGYGISKGGLSRLTSILDGQYRDQGIRTFDLSPGVVPTDMTLGMPMHEGRTEWTPVQKTVELLLAIGAGQLDALSGRFVRAGADTPETLAARAYDIVVANARTLRVLPYGADDPLAT